MEVKVHVVGHNLLEDSRIGRCEEGKVSLEKLKNTR
jgi:hypothetical protein